MSRYLCTDCVSREQCNSEWTTRCTSYVPKEHKQTNEEWFCNLSTEEKARALVDGKLHFRMLDYDGFVEWLKEIHHAN